MDCRPSPMTLLEWLRWTHPDHCQRVVEEVWRQDPRNAAAVLAGPPGAYPVAQCFTWRLSSEGHDYWARLSREPFGDPDQKRGRKKFRAQGRSLSQVAKSWRET